MPFLSYNAKRKSVKQAEAKVLTVQEFQSEKPIDIAKRYAEDMGITFDEEMTELFNETINMIANDSRNN